MRFSTFRSTCRISACISFHDVCALDIEFMVYNAKVLLMTLTVISERW